MRWIRGRNAFVEVFVVVVLLLAFYAQKLKRGGSEDGERSGSVLRRVPVLLQRLCQLFLCKSR